jgi:Spirocyclase AveC-like
VTTTTHPADPSTGPRWRARVGSGVAALALAVFAVISAANLQSGIQVDPRTTNPNPGPPPYPPFLGVDNWPAVLNAFAVLLTIGFFGAAAWMSIRDRRLHWTVIIGIAAFIAGAVDPLANWATFTVFDPRVAHFPTAWPYFNISPLLEPTLSFLGGYAAYYVLTGMGLVGGYKLLVEPLVRPGTWFERHRLLTVFLTGFILGLPLNAIMQFLWLKVGMFVYTEAAGPVLRIGNTQLPLVMVVYDSLIFAMVAVLCVTEDGGRPELATTMAQRLPVSAGRPRVTALRQLVAATAILLTVVLVPLGALGVLRVSGLAKPAYEQFPYPAVKVYDPYGDLERSGKPGPFYR